MASVILGSTWLGLLSDLAGHSVPIPHVQSAPIVDVAEETAVRFEGAVYPTAFLGEGQSRTLTLSARWVRADQAGWLACRELLRYARFTAPDPRLLLRTNAGQAAGVDEALVVRVPSWTDDPQMGQWRSITLSVVVVAA